MLEAWARDGLTDEQIAGNMGITVRSLYNWKKKSIPIFQSLKTGKEVADIEVENALRKKALDSGRRSRRSPPAGLLNMRMAGGCGKCLSQS